MAESGGILSISTQADEKFVFIMVSDSGQGIADIDRELIFEPFYSTKPEVVGTGLGLSVSYGIISGHGGDIKVTSRQNEGSTFTVVLPIDPMKN